MSATADPTAVDMPSTVSVIIPCYRQARFLEDCIHSLRAQTYPHWEAVIVDDGSPDDTSLAGARAVALDNRVKFIQRSNGGPSAARNAGLRASKGAYIQFLDADDRLKPDKLFRHAGQLDSDPTLDLVYGNAWYYEDAEPEKLIRQGFGSDPHEDWIAAAAAQPAAPLLQLVQQNTMPICSPVFRRSLLDRAGFMDESMRALEDWEFWIRCANTGARIAFDAAPEAECLIRLHASSASQDRAFMLGAELAMRVSCMRFLLDKRARRLMLARIGRHLGGQETAERLATLRQLKKSARGIEERAALWTACTFGPGTGLHDFAKPVIGRLPWHFRALAAG